MSLRSALRAVVLAAAGAVAVYALAAAASPQLRRRTLELTGHAAQEPQQPTHIVLPDRVASGWDGLDEAIEEGRAVLSGDVALAGA
jgi:hypothetical protein